MAISIHGGGNLKCQTLYFTSLPEGFHENKNQQTKSERRNPDCIKSKYLQNNFCLILNKALQENVKTIALPAIGTGKMNMTSEAVAHIMYDCIKKLPEGSLTDIRFVLQDKANYKAFQYEHFSITGKNNRTLLHQECLHGNTDKYISIYNNYPSLIDIRRNDGWHILHETAISGSIECLKMMTDIVITNKDPQQREQYFSKCLSNVGSTILHKACQKGHTKMCEYIADIYPSLIDIRRNDGWHILHETAISGSIECLKLMTDIVIKNKDHLKREQYFSKCLDNVASTILHKACQEGHTKMCKYIADIYPSLIDIRRNDGWHILHETAYSGSIECLIMMTDIVIGNKDPQQREQYFSKCLDNVGSTILHNACQQNHTKMCKYIADMYPSLIDIRRNDGWHILHVTAYSGSMECLKMMTDIVIGNKDPQQREQYFSKCLDNVGSTILHNACQQGHTKMCKYIADMYPSLIDIRRNDGWHILHLTAYSGNIGCLKVITDIVIGNKDPQQREQYFSKCLSNVGSTILHKACQNGHTKMCKYIADMYPNLINIRRNDGWHILHETAFSGSIECLKLMTDIVIGNKDPQQREQYFSKCLDNVGSTILHYACQEGHTKMCEYIADKYPSLTDIRRNDRWHILHSTSGSGSIECLKVITDIVIGNKDPQQREQYFSKCLDNVGSTILHNACQYGHTKLCKYIADMYPSLTDIRRNDGWHILHETAYLGSIECLKMMTDIVIGNKDPQQREKYFSKCLDKYGNTILAIARWNGQTVMCRYIADIYPSLTELELKDV